MVKEFHLFRLRFNRTLHLGQGTDFYDRSNSVLHSDTIYAALMSLAAQLGMDPSEQPAYVLSSAFPYAERGEDNFEYFFPRIVLPEIDYAEHDSKPRKTLKNLKWLSQSLFEKSINGQSFPRFEELKDQFVDGFLFDKVATMASLPFTKHVSQRVKVSRIEGEDALPYYVEGLFFKKGCGFFLLADCDQSTAQWLETMLKLLGESGIGTDRNVGYGHFDLERSSLGLNLPENPDAISNLSLYIPQDKAELEGLLGLSKLHVHRLIERGGWISTEPFQTIRKHSISMFEVAGIYAPVADGVQLMGASIDLAPTGLGVDHKVMRCGKAIFIPIKLAAAQT